MLYWVIVATAFKDYYDTLGVARDADQKQIKSAFRRLARKHHPDVNPNDPSATERFREINEAYEVLSDPEKRRRYDEVGPRWREYESWERAGRPGANPFARGAREPQVEYRTATPEDFEDLFGGADPFSDFFHDIFGATARGQTGGRRGGRARARRGEDVEGDAEISLEEAYTGTTRTVELATAEGTRRIEVRIPPGIADGARVRAAGQGGGGRGGGESGDLYVRVHVRPHPVFRRDGDNLLVRVPVPVDVAVLGGEVEVPTLRGTRAQLRIPPGTQNGARLRLRGLGMPRLRGEGNGDLIAEVELRIPEVVTPEVRALAEAMRRSREGAGVA
jgi:curved DNA-binding protein